MNCAFVSDLLLTFLDPLEQPKAKNRALNTTYNYNYIWALLTKNLKRSLTISIINNQPLKEKERILKDIT